MSEPARGPSPGDARPGADLPPAFDEVRIFIDADGTVTICDLWDGLLPVAEALGEVAPACTLPEAAPPGDPGESAGDNTGRPAGGDPGRGRTGGSGGS